MEKSSTSRRPFQHSLRSLLVAMVAFAVGFATRNIVEGLHPLAIGVGLPSSTTPVIPGEVLIIEIPRNSKVTSLAATVLSDETIKLPLAGTIDVADKDLGQIEASLNVAFKKYYPPSPRVQVFREQNYSRLE